MSAVRALVATDVGRLAVRLVAVLAVGAFALGRWLTLLAAPATGDAVLAVLGAAAAGVVLLVAAREPRPGRRAVLAAAAALGGVAVVLLAAGVPAGLLRPDRWSALAGGLGDGIGALPGLTVPYDEDNAWVVVVLEAGGFALLLVAVLAAAWPRRGGRGPGLRGLALTALAVLYAVPAIQLEADHPARLGALFALGLAAVLVAERIEPRRAPLAAGALVAVALVAVLLGPRLDRDEPIVDVQEIAAELQGDGGLRFDWNHSYDPLRWPRDGRVVLRVRADRPAYWKAQSLEDFDGRRWRALAGVQPDPQQFGREVDRRWLLPMRVTLGALESTQYVGAGTTLSIRRAPYRALAATAGAYVVAEDALQRGDAYQALAYVPRPTARTLRAASTFYPGTVLRDLTIGLPVAAGETPQGVTFAPWGDPSPPRLAFSRRAAGEPADAALAGSAYAEVWALARRLKAAAATPYDLVRGIQRLLARPEYVYDETPPPSDVPLADFLLRDRVGYCQQFSGAMALLLRMGGVPARVASGFTPGTLDRDRGEYVVEDLDAHSWVEAYFPGSGWVTFDPTPAIAPPREQLDPLSAPGDAAGAPQPDRVPPSQADQPDEPAAASGGGGGDGGGSWRAPLVVGGLVLLAGAGGAALALARRRPRRLAHGDLAELERALRRVGRPVRGGVTLQELERTLGDGAPGARGYFRAVRDARYAGRPAHPSPADRRALREALAAGLGARGRLRALWALPPRLRRPAGS